MDGYKFTPNNGLLNSVWTEFFNMVSAANNAIEQMPRFAAAQTTEENIFLSRQYACEAKLIRAYAYFQLTRLFGEVPLVDRTMTAEELGNNPALSSDELYEFMCRDLDDAIDTLPESYGKGWGKRDVVLGGSALYPFGANQKEGGFLPLYANHTDTRTIAEN